VFLILLVQGTKRIFFGLAVGLKVNELFSWFELAAVGLL